MKKNHVSKIGKQLLNGYLADGTIWIDGPDYVGRTSDGTEVSMGAARGNEPGITRYLENRPMPSMWCRED